LISTGLALAGITGVQIFLIAGLYKLRKEAFDEKYNKAIRNGLTELQYRYHTNGLDSALYLVDFEAYKLLDDYQEFLTDSVQIALNRYTLSRIYAILVENEKITPFLQAYLRVNELDDNFKNGIFVRSLTLLDQGRVIPVIDDENPGVKMIIDKALHKGALLVNTFNAEGDNFRIQVEYYIDFTHKTRIILGEMIGAMILALFSILVTGSVFLLTIRNMLKHRELSLMKTDFINNMAHELKTPLTTISVASSTLSDPGVIKDQKKIKDLTALIRQQNLHLGRLIDHILDSNLWEQDQFALHKSDVGAQDLLLKIVNAFHLENKEIPFQLDEDINVEGSVISLDEFQLSIALHNLLTNALKYGGDPPEIKLSAKLEDDQLVILVGDNGVGISKEEQKLIFTKFYRGKLVQNKVKGLGLGLFYVRKIIELHEGLVEVVSRPGQGSTFIVRLPLG